jgi:hypothetical protein
MLLNVINKKYLDLSRFAIMRHHLSTILSENKAPVAQLDRVLVSEAKGRGFDSRRAHHIYNLQSK